MKITIEQAIRCMETHCPNCDNKPCIFVESTKLAAETMRKYQKIVNIVSLNDEEFKQCGLKELKEILEVIADGNDN